MLLDGAVRAPQRQQRGLELAIPIRAVVGDVDIPSGAVILAGTGDGRRVGEAVEVFRVRPP